MDSSRLSGVVGASTLHTGRLERLPPLPANTHTSRFAGCVQVLEKTKADSEKENRCWKRVVRFSRTSELGGQKLPEISGGTQPLEFTACPDAGNDAEIQMAGYVLTEATAAATSGVPVPPPPQEETNTARITAIADEKDLFMASPRVKFLPC